MQRHRAPGALCGRRRRPSPRSTRTRSPPLETLPEGAQDTRRRTDGEDAGRELARDDRARSDDRVRTDRDSRADDDPAAEPDVVADLDWLCRFPLRSALPGLERVCRGKQLDVGADLDVVPDVDRRDVQRDEPEVHERPGTNVRVVAVVAVERRPDLGSLAKRAK